MRSFYALVYAYGRHINNEGNRADYVYKFASEAERTRFIDDQERAGNDADPVKASHPDVKKALRYADRGLDWPQAV